MLTAWDRIKTWCEQYAPETLAALNPGATDEDFRVAEERFGVTLPAEIRALYAIHNGQREEGQSLLPAGDWLSLDDVYGQWQVWEKLRCDGEFEESRSDPDAEIRADWWNARWIPITNDGGGNHYCVDLAPTDSGTVGQIITMWHDDGSRSVIAISLADWLIQIADDMESGAIIYSPNEYNGVALREHISEDEEWRGVDVQAL